MKICCIVGKFADKYNVLDGQTVKCKSIYEALKGVYSSNSISKLDTYNWRKQPFTLLLRSIKVLKENENIIIMPAHNGVRIFAPLYGFLNLFFKKKVHYVVIGSWLTEKLKSKIIRKSLLRFNSIFVETSILKKELEEQGFSNVYILNNYKPLKIVDKICKYKEKKLLKICTFSRVNFDKGIEDAINVISSINKNNKIMQLDIYGQIEKEYKNKFHEVLKKDTENVKYCGVIESDNSVNIIKQYDLLLFPTRYKTEGIPGTIIDAFASGIPVLASRWNNYKDIIDEGITGTTFNILDKSDMKKQLLKLYNNQKKLFSMKNNCLMKSKDYCSIDALDILFVRLGGKNESNKIIN